MSIEIPFNRPWVSGREIDYIGEALRLGHLSGDGSFTAGCSELLQTSTGCARALLTHSCTAALEMSALLCDVGVGDEVIMPSFTFVSTANAFVLRGATPVFLDIRQDTLNLDECLLESAITSRTKAIVPVHYAGVGCEMDAIMSVADAHGLAVIEDAAQGIMATYKSRPLGSIAPLGTVSFHSSKNVICGEGGALLVNDTSLADRAEIIREKGTNRSQFYRGETDKYTWLDVGSSYLPSETTAAFLLAQLEQSAVITQRRVVMWNRYHSAFNDLEASGVVRRPVVPTHCVHNAHIYYLRMRCLDDRTRFMQLMREAGVSTAFHYVPLHSAPAGMKYGRSGALPVTDEVADTLVRLPLWVGLEESQERVIEAALDALSRL